VVVVGTTRGYELLPGGVLTRAIGRYEGPRFTSQAAGRTASRDGGLPGEVEINISSAILTVWVR
jgi:hypothetical protein